MTLRSRVFVVMFAVGLLSSSAEAARLAMRSTAEGGGTLVNNGTGDVGTTNGSSFGFTTLWSEMGLASAEDLLVFGSYEGGAGIDPFAELTGLRLVATVPLSLAPCPTDCDTIGEATFGTLGPTVESVQNVAWYGDLLLLPGLTGLPLTMLAGQLYSFGLGSQDVSDLDAIILLYGASNVRIGLTAAVLFPPNNGLAQGAPVFETANSAVPEPTSLLLLGTGLVVASARARQRRRQ